MSVDFSGIWHNQHNSEMKLTVANNGMVTGKYQTGVGSPKPSEEFDLIGFVSGDQIAYVVNFGKYGSLTAWVGQHTLVAGAEKVRTLWQLTENIPDADEPAKLWSSVCSGCDTFSRGPSKGAECEKKRAPSHPLKK